MANSQLNAVNVAIERQQQSNGVDWWIAELAELQHGVVARRQLIEAGLGSGAIDLRVRRGRLHVLYRGVYAVGHRKLTREGRWIAAVFATGSRAVLSHRAAAALLELGYWGALDVTASSAIRGRPGIQIHYLRLPRDEVTIVRRIPVTTVPRTLFDLAAVLPRSQLERVVNEAQVRRLTDPLSLPDLLQRYPRRHGAPAVRAILKDLRPGGTRIRSELEARFQRFLRARRLPRPEHNADLFVGGRWYEIDCLWRAGRLIVELDSRAVHETAMAFESDRARDRALQAAGWMVVRITWRQLHDDSDAVALDLEQLLRSGKKKP